MIHINIPSQNPSEDSINPFKQLHLYDPKLFTHSFRESLQISPTIFVHSFISFSHFSPVHPVEHIQPLTGSQRSAPCPVHSQTLEQFSPHLGTSQPE